MTDTDLALIGASGTVRMLRITRLTEPLDDVPAAYVLLAPRRPESSQAVLHVAHAGLLETALTEHREYPCMHAFADAVAWMPVNSEEEGRAIAADLAAAHRPPCEGCWPPVCQVDAPDVRPYPEDVIGGCLAEQVRADALLEDAIRERRIVRFVHHGERVELEPHEYGLTSDGEPTLFGFREDSAHSRGGSWKTFQLSEIHGLLVTGSTIAPVRPWGSSPIEVRFAASGTLRPQATDEAGEAVDERLLAPLLKDLDALVASLRVQVLETRRLEARSARLRFRLDRSGGPSEISALLAQVEAEQGRVAREIRGLLPVVAGLQRAAR